MNQRELFLRHVAQTSDQPLLGVDVDIASASGVYLVDVHGKKYLDLISGISVSSVGHCHPKVLEAIQKQSQKFMHLMVFGEFNQSPQVEYADKLCKLLPSNLQSIFYTTGGSEAVEGAMKLAKRYTGRTELISFRNAYHGSTQGALSIMGDEYFKNSYRPLLPDVRVLEYNNISALSDISENTAAVFVEMVQGEAGVRAATPEFIAKLREVCSVKGALLVVDEIQTGFGRTGSLFAFEAYGIVPDVLLVVKAMGGGLPIGAFISSQKIMSALVSDPVLGHINTFGGNAVCVRAAEAALDVITSEKLWQNAKTIETILQAKLKHPLIKQVRVKGGLAAVDFGDEQLNMKVIRSCLENGIITDWFLFCPTAMRISPPLIIDEQTIIDAINTVLLILDKM